MPQNKKSAVPAGQPAQPPDFDIDLGAALPPGPPPKRGRGRPRSATGPTPKNRNPNRKVRKDAGIKKTPIQPQPPLIDNTYINSIGGKGIIDNNREGELSIANDLKSKMTLKELKFLEIYFQGGISKKDAMNQAGYTDYNEEYKGILAGKIIRKHESQVGGHRILARSMGAGEVKVLNSLISLMNSKNEMIKLNATAQLAKILGMTTEQVEGAQGITIIFEGTAQQGQPAALALPTEQPVYQAPVRVLQLTK